MKNKKPEIKIWDMDDGMTWIAAADRLDALIAYALYQNGKEGFWRFIAGEFYRIEDLQEIHEITAEAYDTYYFKEKEPEDLEEGEDPVKISFRQKLNQMIADGEKFPCFFATSEF